MLKLNNKNTKTTSMTSSGVFIVNFKHILHFSDKYLLVNKEKLEIAFLEHTRLKKSRYFQCQNASACNFTKSNTPPWVFFTFFYQVAQSVTYISAI